MEMSRRAERHALQLFSNGNDLIGNIFDTAKNGKEDGNDNTAVDGVDVVSDGVDEAIAIAVNGAVDYITNTIETNSLTRSKERYRNRTYGSKRYLCDCLIPFFSERNQELLRLNFYAIRKSQMLWRRDRGSWNSALHHPSTRRTQP